MSGSLRFDDELLQNFMQRFYGYGTYAGDYWFVGMEEGGGNSFKEICQRLQNWNGRGRVELEDIAAYHTQIGAERYFGPQPKLQPTWNRLIRIELSAKGLDTHRENVRQYQQKNLGRHTSTNCLVELLPLPSPSINHWLYAQHSQLSKLVNRKTYEDYYAPRRAEHLRQRIAEYQPKAVVFYSVDRVYMDWWRFIAGVDFIKAAECDRLYIGKTAHTVFAIALHPVAKGVRNEYFHQVGKIISSTAMA
ncbi:hypothetical protein NG796_01560 [Laspinema sp. A4]|uniref:hypothetical protein n=1 Tax=Laspinema sp. D2d TaxID=2953686 RepID=UPI0021BA722B|nr:hypothetical protein [Laspinema sp. D2d]MCT7981974.1 hypothetical protein [Laspinema sp. D2d]